MYFDTHAHLQEPEFDADRDAVLTRARAAGVEAFLCVGITAASSAAAVRLAQSHPDVYAAVGIQPNYTAEAGPDDWQQIVALAEHPRVVAIGETGLDRHWDYAPIAQQCDYFARHIALARQRDLPLVIHCREAAGDLLPMLREAAAAGPLRAVMHSFSEEAAVAAEVLALGLYVSFAGAVTYTNKKFAPLREVAKSMPGDRLLIETDSPYLTPQPLRGKQSRNEPAWIVHTAECLAALRGVPPAEFAAQSTRNARQWLGLP